MQVLVEGPSRRSSAALTGRTDTMKRVVFDDVEVPATYSVAGGSRRGPLVRLRPGDYVAVQARSSTAAFACWTRAKTNRVRGMQQTALRAIGGQLVTGAECGVGRRGKHESCCSWGGLRQVVEASTATLFCVPLAQTTLREFVAVHGSCVPGEDYSRDGLVWQQ
jgi:TRAM domain